MSNEQETKPFHYTDSPAGKDLLKKIQWALKPTTMTAFAVSTVDVALYSHPKTYLATLGRILFCSWPIFGISGVFIMTQNLAESIRGKDDKVNWALGGAAAGSVYGLWRKSVPKTVSTAFVFAVLGVLYKYSLEEGFQVIPSEWSNPEYGNVRSVRSDYSLTKERPRNWTTGNQAQ